MSSDAEPRDLIGYGSTPPSITWPNGARVAVSVVINFEEGAELQVGDGDSVSERVGEVISVVEPGKRDMGQEQIFGYGTRSGIWRFLETLNRYNTRATFFCCGQAMQRSPLLAQTIIDHGHEAACHGWRWRPHSDFDTEEQEKAALLRCIEAHNASTGQRPYGFFCRGSESPWTRKLLSELEFTYTSNAFDDDLPYQHNTDLVVIPYNLDCNDMKFFHPNGFVRAGDMIEYVKDALDQLRLEAAQGRSSTLSIGYHLRISGRPARFKAFSEVLSYLNGLGAQIWLTTRLDIAQAFKREVTTTT